MSARKTRSKTESIGQTHKFGIRYLANYANEAACREDTGRQSNGEIFRDNLTKCAHTPTHRDWCGYWQGNKRLQERLAARAAASTDAPRLAGAIGSCALNDALSSQPSPGARGALA